MESISLYDAVEAFGGKPAKDKKESFDRWKTLDGDSKLFLFSPNPRFVDLIHRKDCGTIIYISSIDLKTWDWKKV